MAKSNMAKGCGKYGAKSEYGKSNEYGKDYEEGTDKGKKGEGKGPGKEERPAPRASQATAGHVASGAIKRASAGKFTFKEWRRCSTLKKGGGPNLQLDVNEIFIVRETAAPTKRGGRKQHH